MHHTSNFINLTLTLTLHFTPSCCKKLSVVPTAGGLIMTRVTFLVTKRKRVTSNNNLQRISLSASNPATSSWWLSSSDKVRLEDSLSQSDEVVEKWAENRKKNQRSQFQGQKKWFSNMSCTLI